MMLCALCLMNFAVLARYNSVSRCEPSIAIFGNTAYCALSVQTKDSSDKISAVIRLCTSSGLVLRTWEKAAVGTLDFSDSCSVTSPGTYYLKVEVDVDGANGSDFIQTERSAVKK